MRFLRWLDEKFEQTLMAASLWLIVFIMFLQVIMRYFFKQSLSWSEELSRYIFIWFTFIGMSFAIRNNSHMRIDILETILPKLRKPMETIGDIGFLVFCIYMISPALKTLSGLWRTWQTSPAMELPMFFVYLALLVGVLLSIVRLVQKYAMKLFNLVKKGES